MIGGFMSEKNFTNINEYNNMPTDYNSPTPNYIVMPECYIRKLIATQNNYIPDSMPYDADKPLPNYVVINDLRIYRSDIDLPTG
jgi:hypothetical protein